MATNAKRDFYNVTVKGVKVKVAKDAMDDMETVELLGAMQDGDVFAFPKLCKKLFGEKSYETIKEKLKDSAGTTSVTAMTEFFTDALKACNALEAKNSSGSPE